MLTRQAKNLSDKLKHFHARFQNKFPVRLCAKISCQSWPALVSKPRPVSYSSVGQDDISGSEDGLLASRWLHAIRRTLGMLLIADLLFNDGNENQSFLKANTELI